MKKTILSLTIAALVADSALANDTINTLQVIEINAGVPDLETAIRETTAGIKVSPVSDGGELLRSLAGVSATRMGGRALDPIIRGQQETQLNVLMDGGYIQGGCPNRMDPPTAYSSVDSYDRVTVIKGNRSVIYGGGGSGGTVLFERDWPEIDEQGYNAKLSGSYKENGDQWELGADLAAGNELGYVRFIAHQGESNNYKDGRGKKIPAEYDSQSNTLLMGINLGDDTRLQASFEKADENDVLFPGAKMNSPYAEAKNYRLKLEHEFTQASALEKITFEAYRSDVAHLMENKMMSSPSTSDTQGGRIKLEADLADTLWTLGIDTQRNERDAYGTKRSNGNKVFSLWPGVELDQTGIFIEGETQISSDDLVKAGLRYDYVKAQASKANQKYGMGTPAKAYKKFYGTTDTDSHENNIGGFASWTHRLNDQYRFQATLSRSVRTADATERYITKTPMMGMKWIGNPQIKPEKHHQIEAVLASSQEAMNWSITGWYNRVDDYILRAKKNGSDLYSNVDAELYGLEAEMSYQLNQNWQLSNSMAWLAGKNQDNNTNLSRISPLELNTALDYQKGAWKTGLELKLVAKQNKVCLTSDTNCAGQDVRKTPGYGLVNLYAEYATPKGFVFSFGVDNLLDKAYSLHESRDYILQTDTVQVAEPGQNIWLKVSQSF